MTKTPRPKLLLALCLLQLLFLGSRLSANGAESTTKVDYKKMVPILTPMKEVVPTPEFNLATPDGKKISLRDFRGKIVMLNFWATWCVPCREEMPAMEKLYQALAPRGFRIAAVSIDEGSPEDVQAFARELGLSFDILQDRSTKVQQIYQTTGVPESFLLNRQGKIVKRVIGAQDWNSKVNRDLIERLLDEPT